MTRSSLDRQPLRPGGAWSVEKLVYVERYAGAFTRAMKGKWERLVYIDLLAGPGKGVRRDTGEEFDGSPLRALKVRPPSTICTWAMFVRVWSRAWAGVSQTRTVAE